eukprot:TRINITY_DN24933_c0_g1_i1.p1 TRINITY_DN24933_c0_g1~~TRINITY_DN24933_c0_g1_i1.p1  ORF type:complete len:533 (+),score=75.52 TRINITY_DN24933_c0_g1_i1:165-1601(+)
MSQGNFCEDEQESSAEQSSVDKFFASERPYADAEKQLSRLSQSRGASNVSAFAHAAAKAGSLNFSLPRSKSVKMASDELFVRGHLATLREMSYKRVPLPSPQEVSEWMAALAKVPASGSADASVAVDYTTRFCGIAYARNDGVQCKISELRSQSGECEALEVQLHASADWAAGAHLVVYVYRLQGTGVGVVLAYKGSTMNREDWKHNLHIFSRRGDSRSEAGHGIHWGVDLFPDLKATTSDESVAKAQVFTGFLDYWRLLDLKAASCSLESWRGLLAEWGSPLPETADDLKSWLYAGHWKWCVAVGHSLGGAMANIAAVDLTVRSGRSVALSTLSSPSAGNTAFVRLENERLMPAGGLEVSNHGDTVPLMGYHGFKVWSAQKFHGGRSVVLGKNAMQGLDPYHVHLSFSVPSTVYGEPSMPVIFKFPGMTYKPSATHDNSICFLGAYWKSAAGTGQVDGRLESTHNGSSHICQILLAF